MSRVLRAAFTVGGLWAFVEVVFTYVIGRAPTTDVVEVFLLPVLASVLCHLLFYAAARVRPHPFFETLITAGVVLPCVVYFLRSRGQFVPLQLMAGLFPIALGVLLVISETRKPSEVAWMTPWRILSILATYLVAALAFVIRSDRQAAVTSDLVLAGASWCVAVAILLALMVAMTRRFAFVAMFALVGAGSIGIAVQRGSAPPRYHAQSNTPPSLPSEKQKPPNVLLIVLDTVRVDHLDLYGYSRPTFSQTSRYLKDGLVFDWATSSGTFSLTSHGALFTGLLPSAHGAHPIMAGEASYGRAWPDITTMADWLHARGYRTAGVSGNDIFLAAWTGLQKGFDTFSATGIRSQRFTPFASQVRRLLSRVNFVRRRTLVNSWSAEQITDAAIDLVSEPTEPFFLFLNYFDAHEPHLPIGSPPWLGPGPLKPIDAYDSEIAAIDSAVARLLRVVEERGQLDHTLLIVAADHGEYFNEWHLHGHPAASYEPSTHVPLVLRLPGILEAGRSERRTGLHEVFKMVQDVVNKNSLDWLKQIDLTPRILNEAWARKDYDKVPPKDGRPSITVVFEGNLKLIHRLSGGSELFDLDTDPHEQKNLFDSADPKLVAAREQMVKQVMLRATRGPGPTQALSEDAKERLRALGYLR